MKEMIDEAFERLDAYRAGLLQLSDLLETNNFKYLTRAQRDIIYSTLLENIGSLEDVTKALVKAARGIKRARLDNDEQLSRMIIAMTDGGLKVDDFLQESTVIALYGDVQSPETPADPSPS